MLDIATRDDAAAEYNIRLKMNILRSGKYRLISMAVRMADRKPVWKITSVENRNNTKRVSHILNMIKTQIIAGSLR